MNNNWGYPEQIQACDKLFRSRGGVLWWAPGQGKTRPAIMLFEALRQAYKWPFPSVCVAIIRRAGFLDFRKELAKINYDCVVMEDNLEMPNEVEIATLQKPTVLLISSGSITKSVHWLLVDPRVRFGIIDELWQFKNPVAQRSKAVQRFSLRFKTIGLSGSAMTAQDIEDVYGQLMAVQKHRYVASNLTKFREKFMHYKIQETRGGKKFPLGWPKPGAYRQIMELCKDCVDVYFPETNKRKITMQTIEIEATPEQRQAFSDLKKYMELQVDGRIIEYKNTLQCANKIQQIANGWVEDENEVIHDIPSNKLDALIGKVKEVVDGKQRAMIWCAYRHDVHKVYCALNSAGIATVQFIGGEPFDDHRWQTEAKVCVGTEAMGSTVNHFEQVAYTFYFSMNYKWMDLQQSMKRTDRYSSLHPEAFYYFFQVIGSLDPQVLKQVLASRDWEKRLIDIGQEVRVWLQHK